MESIFQSINVNEYTFCLRSKQFHEVFYWPYFRQSWIQNMFYYDINMIIYIKGAHRVSVAICEFSEWWKHMCNAYN